MQECAKLETRCIVRQYVQTSDNNMCTIRQKVHGLILCLVRQYVHGPFRRIMQAGDVLDNEGKIISNLLFEGLWRSHIMLHWWCIDIQVAVITHL